MAPSLESVGMRFTLRNLGRNDAGLTADYPIVNVYNKNGKKTYAAYNYRATPLAVTFSDGVELIAQPHGLTVKQ